MKIIFAANGVVQIEEVYTQNFYMLSAHILITNGDMHTLTRIDVVDLFFLHLIRGQNY